MRSLAALVVSALLAGVGLAAGPSAAAADGPRVTSLPACRAASCATPIVITHGFPDGTTGVTIRSGRTSFTRLGNGLTATSVHAPGFVVTRISDGRTALTTTPILGPAAFTRTSDGATFPTLTSGRSAFTGLSPRLPAARR
jgi:hypothetical protein